MSSGNDDLLVHASVSPFTPVAGNFTFNTTGIEPVVMRVPALTDGPAPLFEVNSRSQARTGVHHTGAAPRFTPNAWAAPSGKTYADFNPLTARAIPYKTAPLFTQAKQFWTSGYVRKG